MRWHRLHAVVYLVTMLSLLHCFLQSKIDVTQAVLMGGFFVWLMAYRALKRSRLPINTLSSAGIAVVAGMMTALIEAAWYGAMTAAMASRVLAANLDFSFTIRPAWWVLVAGLALALLHALRGRMPAGRGDGALATARVSR